MTNLFDSNRLQKKLKMEQFEVTRRKQTQQPFYNKYWNFFELGTYQCIICHQSLFSSEHKYEDGFGWPAFYNELPNAKIKKLQNHDLDYVRTQAVCNKCNSHIGYIFKDGPIDKGGNRYSVNSASLQFYPR